jgi:hypothetical protein
MLKGYRITSAWKAKKSTVKLSSRKDSQEMKQDTSESRKCHLPETKQKWKPGNLGPGNSPAGKFKARPAGKIEKNFNSGGNISKLKLQLEAIMNPSSTLQVSHTIPKSKICVARNKLNIFVPANHATGNGEQNGEHLDWRN